MWGIGEIKALMNDSCALDFHAVEKFNVIRDLSWLQGNCLPLHPKCLLATVYAGRHSTRMRYSNDKIGIIRQILKEAPSLGLSGGVLKTYFLYVYLAANGGTLASHNKDDFMRVWKETLAEIEAHPEISAPQGELGMVCACAAGAKVVPYIAATTANAEPQVVIRARYPCHPVDLSALCAPGESRAAVRRFKFSSSYPVPVLAKSLANEYSVETKYPSELQRGDIVMIMRNSSESIIAELADAEMGQSAREVRAYAAQWRDALEEWDGDAEKLGASVKVSVGTAANWLSGKLKIAPRSENLDRLSRFFSKKGIKFDADRCAQMATFLFGAHKGAGRRLRSILDAEINRHADRLLFQKCVCVDAGGRKIFLDLYAVGLVHRRKLMQSQDGLNAFV